MTCPEKGILCAEHSSPRPGKAFSNSRPGMNIGVEAIHLDLIHYC